MLARHVRRGDRHFVEAGRAKWAAGRSEHDLFDRAAVGVFQRLEDGIVLAVHRQQRGAGIAHRAQHHLAGADQRLLVGQCHAGAAADGGQGGGKAGGAGDGGHGPVGRQRGGLHHGLGAGGGVDAGTGQGLTQRKVAGGVGDHREAGLQRNGLLGQQGGIAAGNQGTNLEAIRRAVQQIDRLGANAPVLPSTVTVRGACVIATALLHDRG